MAAPVHALAVYQALLRNGYSSTQAIGIMANMWYESSLNPEADAMDSNGYRSVGLVQFNGASYPHAGSMVTGNPTADINSQVAYLATIDGPKSKATAGSTPGQVAGNWAYYFERCAACSPSGSYGASASSNGGYNDRVNFASTVASWAQSGNWTVSSGTGGTTGGGGSATGSGTGGGYPAGGSATTTAATTPAPSTGNTCLLSFPVVGCVMPKTLARQLLGGLVIAGAFVIVLVGADLLFKSAGLGGSGGGMGKTAARTGELLALFPPAEAAGVTMSAVGGSVNRTAAHRARGRTAATGERRAATGETNAVTARRRAATGAANATTAQGRAKTYKYRSRTDREVGRSRAKTYRKDSKTRRYAAETGRAREDRLAASRRARPAAAAPKPALATAPERRSRPK
ncbi:MAG TPA: phage tail tip lysozyme [Streptosporangiaceae bacterium]|jgi:hypothetical protein